MSHELKHTRDNHTEMKTTWELHQFFQRSLCKPSKDLFEKSKGGRGIYSRVFYYIPAHGEGSVNHWQDVYEKLDGSSKLHQVRTTASSTAEVGILETRQRSCHQCESCWQPEGCWLSCEKKEVVGEPNHVELSAPVRLGRRVLRSHKELKDRGKLISVGIKKDMYVCLEIDDSKMDEDMPWCIVKVTELLCEHLGQNVKHTRKKDWTWMGALHTKTKYFTGVMMTRPRPGVNTFEESDWSFYFFPEDVRVVDVELNEKQVSRTRKNTVYDLKKKGHQTILDSLKED